MKGRTVDHEVCGGAGSGLVDLLDSPGQRLPCRQQAVGLDCERDDDRDTNGDSRSHDADRFLGVGYRHGGDLVRRRRGERADLNRVITLSLLSCHQLAGFVTVSAGADVTADHRGDTVGGSRRPDLLGKIDRRTVDGVEPLGRVTEPGGPIRVGTPGRGVDHQPCAEFARDDHVFVPIPAQTDPVVGVLEQREGGEERQLDTVMEKQVGLDAAISDEQPVEVQPGQRPPTPMVSAERVSVDGRQHSPLHS